MKTNLIKTGKELEIMKKAGKIAAVALSKVLKEVKPGVTLEHLDNVAREEIETMQAAPSFMTVDDYKWTICVTVNEQVVHGIPSKRRLNDGDILGIDIGALYKGFHSDTASTVGVGQISKEDEKFMKIGKETLKKAINKAKIGGKIGDISAEIQKNIEEAGYSIVKNLTGHGVGRQLHEEPMVPGFGKKGIGPRLQENMVLAIEVIYAKGKGDVVLDSDGWTISTKDGTLGGLFEQTIAIKNSGPIVLTPYL